MSIHLSPIEARVLGSLIEKEATTPEYYPLSLNALVNACNQKNNREPVMQLNEDEVRQALHRLQDQNLAAAVHDSRVTKYEHHLQEVLNLTRGETAVLCVLLLRGPQTPGELRSRSGRMAEFDSLAVIQSELEILADQPEPLVRLQARQPGQKEDRWQQLLASEAALPETGDAPPGPLLLTRPGGDGGGDAERSTGAERPGLEQRIDLLESEVAALRSELTRVNSSLDALRDSLGG